MPNWTSNRIEAPAEVLKKYTGFDKDGTMFFDFNKVIPRPEVYNDPEMSSGYDTDLCIYWYLSGKGKKRNVSKMVVDELKYPSKTFEDVLKRELYSSWSKGWDDVIQRCLAHSDEYYRRGKKYVDAYKKYGHTTWYDWSVTNWGTKWNACDSYFDFSNEESEWVEFETAWCFPEPIFKKIMDDNPGCRIAFYWTDEDYDGNHSMIRNEDGTISVNCVFDPHHYDED